VRPALLGHRDERDAGRCWGLVLIGTSGFSPPHREPASDWFIVNPTELPSLQGSPIYGVCFSGHAPKAIVKSELRLPVGHPLRSSGGVLIVHTLINAKGSVVKAQILKGPDSPELRAAVADCLARWRFEPAFDAHGKPAAVHFTISLAVKAKRTEVNPNPV
jgi:TonB family protein